MRRTYLDGRYGQVHTIVAGDPGDGRPPLLCLHATAYSATSLRPLVEALAADGRRVLALDTPGYGGSDGPSAPITVEDYADALLDTIDGLGTGAVDIFGYHTGITIAVEAALRRADAVRRIAMVGIPLFPEPDREVWKQRLVVRHELTGALDQFEERWGYLVEKRAAGLTLERGFANFVDELRAWPNGWWAHDALFRHSLADRLPALTIPVLVINPRSALAEMSRQSAGLMPAAQIVERPDMEGAIFETHAPEIAALVGDFLAG